MCPPFFRSVSLAVTGGLVLFAALPAFGTQILELKTDSFLSMQPGSTDSITFRMTNVGTSAISNNFNGWVLGLQFVAQPGSTGTVSVAGGGSPLTSGTVNPMPLGDLQISQPSIAVIGNNATINGLTNYWFMNVNTLTQPGTVAVGQNFDMGNLLLTASANALGTWDVYTIQQDEPLFKTYYFNSSNAERAFNNIRWGTEEEPRGDYSLKLGEVAVVPEPSILALLGMAGLGAGGYAWRRRGRRLAVAGGTVVA